VQRFQIDSLPKVVPNSIKSLGDLKNFLAGKEIQWNIEKLDDQYVMDDIESSKVKYKPATPRKKTKEHKEPEYIKNPFPSSLYKNPVYHATSKNFSKFKRAPHGVYFTPARSYAIDMYGLENDGGKWSDASQKIIAAYVDVRNPYPTEKATEEQIDWFYNMDYNEIAKWFNELKAQGYDHFRYSGDSMSFAVFGDGVKIVNAETGKPM